LAEKGYILIILMLQYKIMIIDGGSFCKSMFLAEQ